MSARAWERRRVNKRDRILHRKVCRAFGIPHRWRLGEGSYTLARQQQEAYLANLQVVAKAVLIDPAVLLRERLGMWT
jgi:hypothetical protein